MQQSYMQPLQEVVGGQLQRLSAQSPTRSLQESLTQHNVSRLLRRQQTVCAATTYPLEQYALITVAQYDTGTALQLITERHVSKA